LLNLLYKNIGSIIFVLVCAFAILKGDRTERLGAGLLLVAWAASINAQLAEGMLNTQYAVLAIDVIVLAILSVLAWRSERSWPMWAAAFQAIGVAVHIARGAGLRISGVPYIAAVNLSAYGVMAALLVGTIIVWRERDALTARPIR
jgi:hypothetical protein